MGQLITNIGFIVGAFGFLIAWFYEPRIIGITIFLIGFYAAIGGYIVGAISIWKTDGKKAFSHVGVSTGLAIASGSYVATTFFGNEQVATMLFYLGTFLIGGGIVGSWFINSS